MTLGLRFQLAYFLLQKVNGLLELVTAQGSLLRQLVHAGLFFGFIRPDQSLASLQSLHRLLILLVEPVKVVGNIAVGYVRDDVLLMF